jgi:hypothetical protein
MDQRRERVTFRALASEIIDVDVSSRAGIVSQVPARVIRIFVDHDIIAVPVPIVDVTVIEWRDPEIESVKPKTVPVAATQVEHMAGTETACEVPVLPWMILMKTWVVAALIMSNPLIVSVNVRRVRMPGLIRVIAVFVLSTIYLSAIRILAVIALGLPSLIAAILTGCRRRGVGGRRSARRLRSV